MHCGLYGGGYMRPAVSAAAATERKRRTKRGRGRAAAMLVIGVSFMVGGCRWRAIIARCDNL